MLNAAEEVFFWSGIMENHAEFFLLNLSHREQEFIKMAQNFKVAFTEMINEAQVLIQKPDAQQDTVLMSKAKNLLASFVAYKRLALRKLLQCDIELKLTPTFVNHMLNEAAEYNRALHLAQLNVPTSKVLENIQLLKIWLPDAAGHAASITAELDPTETALVREAEEFKNDFEHLYIKADELGNMLIRACIANNSLVYMNEQVIKKIKDFIEYLYKIMKLRKQCKPLGVLKPLIPDHMIREEQYFLSRLDKVNERLQ